MNPERWDRIKELVNRCLECEPDKRTAILDGCCAEDAELRNEVESLLGSFEEAGEGFLENPAIDTAGESLTGQTIGLYLVGEKIAEGGMGAVYRAVRQSDFQKRVAIKVVKRGMDSDFILSRFRQERQILAGLDHPNVARLLDGGVTNEGRPYLVMEYVEGARITDYCDEHRLDERARLEMVRTVCSAVQYAHQNLVVHRDLKPANILVTADGEPKLLDFGIAKLLEPDAGATSTLVRMLSPECASPEQVRGEAITTATDIYSIGVLLYRLLTGEPPYRFDDRSPAEVARVICERDPKTPGEIKRVHADLDNIVLKAMHKDPARRYSSAEQLSEDIRRYLEGLPVIARKDTLAYRASKFVGRHRGATIAAGLAILSLIAGICATLWQAHRSRTQEQIAKAVNDFLRNDVLAQASANKQAGAGARPDPDLKVRTALDRAATRIDGEFKGQPLIEASIRQTMAEAYNDLGLYPEAERHAKRAIDLRRNALGEKNADTLASMETLAGIYESQSRYADALALQSKILDLRRHVSGARDPEVLATMDGMAAAYRHLGKLSEAEAIEAQVLDGLRKLYGEEKPETLIAMNDMATIYEDEGKYPQAEELYFRSNEIRHRVLGDEHPDTLSGMNNLASVYSHQGKYDKAEQIQSQVLEARRRILGPEHPDTLTSMNNLAVDYTRDGKYALAEPLMVTVMQARRKSLGEENPSTLLITMNLASVYARQGKLDGPNP